MDRSQELEVVAELASLSASTLQALKRANERFETANAGLQGVDD